METQLQTHTQIQRNSNTKQIQRKGGRRFIPIYPIGKHGRKVILPFLY